MTTPQESIEALGVTLEREAQAQAARVLRLQAVHDRAVARARIDHEVPVSPAAPDR